MPPGVQFLEEARMRKILMLAVSLLVLIIASTGMSALRNQASAPWLRSPEEAPTPKPARPAPTPSPYQATPGFSYAGLNLATTEEDLRARYPSSVGSDARYVKLSAADSHDHIGSIGLSDHVEDRNIRLSFEREVPEEKVRAIEYARCDTIVSSVRAAYGEPGEAYDSNEEAMITRVYKWRNDHESLMVYCFYSRSSDAYHAEFLRISAWQRPRQ